MKTKTLKIFSLVLFYIYILGIGAIVQLVFKYAKSYSAVIAMSYLANIAMLIPCIITIIYKKISLAELGYSKKNLTKQILIGVAIYIVLFLIVAIIPMAFGVDKKSLLGSPVSSFGILILEIFVYITVENFTEEFIYRGYFYSKISSLSGSELSAVFLSSILFGLAHLQAQFNVIQAVCATLIGLAYGFARYKIKNCSVLSLSIAHWLQDSTILIVSFVLLSPR